MYSCLLISFLGDYNIVNNLIESNLYKESSKYSRKFNEITLTTEGTINHIHDLVFLSSKWPGPISVAIFLTDPKINLMAAVTHMLHRCFPSLRQSVSFHLVYPLNKPVSTDFGDYAHLLDLECNESAEKLFQEASRAFPNENYDHGVLVPVNLLRNVARKNAWSEFVFLIDIDMYPSHNLYNEYVSFLETKKLLNPNMLPNDISRNALFVVPAYEIDEAVAAAPDNKSQLLNLIRLSKVKPFYQDVCWKCQKWTEYDRWEQLVPSSELGVAYSVQWKDPWEPFFISSHMVPYYDERFKQYGFNRMSQVI